MITIIHEPCRTGFIISLIRMVQPWFDEKWLSIMENHPNLNGLQSPFLVRTMEWKARPKYFGLGIFEVGATSNPGIASPG